MRDSRPHLPAKETRSVCTTGLPAAVRNSTPFGDSKAVAEKTLGGAIPQTATWRTAFQSEEERIDICDFTEDGGIVNSFAVYGQLGNFTPYYWKVEGLPTGSSVPSKDFLREKCRIGDSASVTWTEDVLSAEEVDVREMGESVPIPYSRFRFFFVNDRPGANWAHPCRYVFVSEDCSSFTVLYKTMPPRLFSKVTSNRIRLSKFGGGEGEKVTAEKLEDVKSAVYGYANDLRANALSYTTGNAARSYFVLISGGADPESNGIRFWCDTAMLYSTLTLKYGVSKDNIYVYMSDGTSSATDANLGDNDDPVLVSSPLDLDGDSSSDIDGAATKSNVSSCFSSLRSRLTSSDQLFVFVTSHGSSDGTSGVNNRDCLAWLFSTTGSAYFRDDELASWTSGFACPVAFAIETCYSGGFVDDITQTANRVIATACNHYESSWGRLGGSKWYNNLVGSTYAYNCWAAPFVAALRGYKPKPFASYGYPWSDGSSVNADSNSDGLVSFNEARLYAYNNDSARCTLSSHTSTCGDDNGVEHPQYGESTSGLGDSFFVLKQSSSDPTPTITLQTALDNTSLTFTTGGSSSWIGQSTRSHDGVDAARSGALDNSQTNWLQTVVSGPGTVSFWWYASSEAGYDYLEFLVDGVLKDSISGTNNVWAQKSFAIETSGSHAIVWRYRKDGSVSKGDDAGFVDQVSWVPSVVRPANDNFANATAISGRSGAVSGSTVNATRESGEPLPTYRTSATNTIWWAWTAPASGSVSFSTANTTFDTVMGVYTGSSVSSLSKVKEDDDGGSNYTSLCTFNADSGVTYYIAVAGYGNSNVGTVHLSWEMTQLAEYTVVFNRMDYSGTTYQCSLSVGAVQSLPRLWEDMGWSYSGHYFLGWASRSYSSGSGQVGVVEYDDGELVLDLASAGATVYLYAVWSTSPLQSFPKISQSASASTVNAAIDSIVFADSGVKTAIGGSAREYSAFKSWAGGIAGGEAAVAASPHAAAAYLLGSTSLFGTAPKVDLNTLGIGGGLGTSRHAMTVSVTVKDGGRSVLVDSTKVAAMFEATSDLRSWSGAAKLTPEVKVLGTDANGKMTFSVTPGNGTAPSAFLRIRK